MTTGELVRLKSGGPVMTVEMIRPDGVIMVCWMVGKRLQRDGFLPEMLESVETKEEYRAS